MRVERGGKVWPVKERRVEVEWRRKLKGEEALKKVDAPFREFRMEAFEGEL